MPALMYILPGIPAPQGSRRKLSLMVACVFRDEPTFADAILDRIVHNAYRVELDGQSMRMK